MHNTPSPVTTVPRNRNAWTLVRGVALPGLVLGFLAAAPGPAPAGTALREIPCAFRHDLPVPGWYSLRFSLWPLERGGGPVWSEVARLRLENKSGTHSLGSVSPLEGVDFSRQLWVEVAAREGGTWVPLSGRMRLEPRPYALWSAEGRPGPAGEPGATGPRGATGPAGPPGTTGRDGPPGATGPIVPDGPPGPAGPPGATGTTGTTGTTGVTGSRGATGPRGERGDAGTPASFALEGVGCPEGSYLRGFDAAGSPICAQGDPGVDFARPCADCHAGQEGAGPAPDVMTYWDGTWWDRVTEGSPGVQQGGHGDPGGKAATTCDGRTGCHDLRQSGWSHRNGILEGPGNPTRNTYHLRREFINTDTAYPWNQAGTFNAGCSTLCHPAARRSPCVKGTRLLQFGRAFTPPDGDLVAYPIDDAMSSWAETDEPDFPVCATCHDPHGTGTRDSNGRSNSMLRDNYRFTSTLCVTCHNAQ